MKREAKKQFNNGDILLYAREAGEDANMSISVGGFVGSYHNGIVVGIDDDTKQFPLVGVLDISQCFDVVEQQKTF